MPALSILEPPPTVELAQNLKRQFYPTLALLWALTQIRRRPGSVDQNLDSQHMPTNTGDIYHNFLSKLAFLSCTDTGPNTISACTILQRFDETVEYVFGFNQVDREKGNLLEKGIAAFIRMFQEPPVTDDQFSLILRYVLGFNAGRVRGYLKAYTRYLAECIQICEESRVPSLLGILRELQARTARAIGTSSSRHDVDVIATEELIQLLCHVYNSDDFQLVRERASEEETRGVVTKDSPWTGLVHVTGRLMIYKRSVEVCRLAFKTWPRLHENFEVIVVPSSVPMSQVLPATEMTAVACMGKTTSNDSPLRQAFDSQLQTLDSEFGLDQKVRECWHPKPRPIVHAEILVHHYLETSEGGTNEARFFRRDKFIGSSKPPCRLCWYYFQLCGTNVEVRTSHRNLYLSWRLGDVYEYQGKRAETRREKLMRDIKERLRDDLLQVLKDGGDWRPNDSSNYSASRRMMSDIVSHASSTRTTMSTPAMTRAAFPEVAIEALQPLERLGFGPSGFSNAANSLVAAQFAQIQAPAVLHSMAPAHNIQAPRVNPAVRPAHVPNSARPPPLSDSQYSSPATSTEQEESDDDDEDGGGKLLFKGRTRT